MLYYILTMELSQLFYGPLSDIYGRKPLIIVGTVIFLCGSLLSATTSSNAIFLSGHTIKGLRIGARLTVTSAILADESISKQLAYLTSYTSMVYSAVPLLVPVPGGYIAQHLN